MNKTFKRSLAFLSFFLCAYAANAFPSLPHSSVIILKKAVLFKTFTTTLPGADMGFSSSVNKNKILLNWSTTSEKNTTNFVVQRSNNNRDWENIGVVTAAGNTKTITYYSFIDDEPVNGLNYYRLAQSDVNTNQNFSKTISANFKNTFNLLKIYPNPVMNGLLNISLTKNATIYLYSNSGSKLMEKTLSSGRHQIDVSKFAKGNYFIKMDKEMEGFIIQ